MAKRHTAEDYDKQLTTDNTPKKDPLWDNLVSLGVNAYNDNNSIQSTTTSDNEINSYVDRLGENINPYTEDLRYRRAKEQSTTEQFGNGIKRLINIVPGIVGGLASTLDLPSYFDSSDTSNWLTDITNQTQDNVNAALPIYKENPNKGFDMADPAWWSEGGSGLIKSAVEFMVEGTLLGGVVGKGLSTIGQGINGISAANKVRKGSAFINNLTKAEKIKKARIMLERGDGFKVAENLTGSAANSYLLSHIENTMESNDVYNETVSYNFNKGLSIEESRKKAGEAAATTSTINRFNFLLNLTSARRFLKPNMLTRNLVKKHTALSTIKELGLESGQEALEELTNHVAAEAGKAIGRGEKVGTEEVLDYLSDDHAWAAAFWGALGGLAQTGGTKLITGQRKTTFDGETIKQSQYNNKLYDKQQLLQKEYDDMADKAGAKTSTDVFNDFTEQIILNAKLEEAYDKNDTKKIEELEALSLVTQAETAFKYGTTERLIQTYKDLANGPQEKGMSKDYKEKANKAIDTIERLEKVYNNSQAFANSKSIFYNRGFREQLVKQYDNITNEMDDSLFAFNKEVNRIAKSIGMDKSGNGKDDTSLTYDINNLEYNPGKSLEQTKKYSEFLNKVKTLEYYKDKKQNEDYLEKTSKSLDKIDAKLETLMSSETQAKVKKERKEAEKVVKEALEKQAKKDKKDKKEAKNNAKKDNKQKKEKEKANKEAEKTAKESEKEAKENPTEENKQKAEEARRKAEEVKNSNKETTETPKEAEARNSQDDSQDTVEMTEDELFAAQEAYMAQQEAEASKKTKTPKKKTRKKKKKAKKEKDNVEAVLAPVITDSKIEDIKDDIEKANDTLVENDSEKGENTDEQIEYQRSRNADNKMAYLSRGFLEYVDDEGKTRKKDIDNSLIDSASIKLLEPGKFLPGTKITIKVEDNIDEDTTVNNPLKPGETVKWSVLKSQLTPEQIIAYTPIIIVDEHGDKIAYIHSLDWVTDKHIFGDVKQNKANLLALRNIVMKNPVNTTITRKSNGRLIQNVDGAISVAEAMGDDTSLQIGIAQLGELKGIPTKIINQIINIDNIKEGHSYLVLPLSNEGYIAVPAINSKITDEIADSMVSAVETFITGEHNEFSDYVLEHHKINLLERNGLNEYMSMFTYIFTPGDMYKNLGEYFKYNEVNSDYRLLNITGNSIDFGAGGGIRTNSLSKNTPVENRATLLKVLKEHLLKSYSSVSINSLNNKSAIVGYSKGEVITLAKDYKDYVKKSLRTNILGVNIGTEEKPNFIYTIQPKVEFDNSFINIKPKDNTDKEKSTIPNDSSVEELNKVNKELEKELSKKTEEEFVKAVFPDTKVKQVVYHGGTVTDKFSEKHIGKATINYNKNDYGQPKAFYFTTSEESSKTYGKVTKVILNVEKPSVLEQTLVDKGFGLKRKNKFQDAQSLSFKNKDGFILKDIFDAKYLKTLSTRDLIEDKDGTKQKQLNDEIKKQYGDTIGVFNSEQIHILTEEEQNSIRDDKKIEQLKQKQKELQDKGEEDLKAQKAQDELSSMKNPFGDGEFDADVYDDSDLFDDEDLLPLDEQGEEALRKSVDSLFVSKSISYKHQYALVKTITNDIYSELLKRGGEITNDERIELFNSWKDKLKYIQLVHQGKGRVKMVTHIQEYLDNYDKLINQVELRIKKFTNVKVNEELENQLEDDAILEKKSFEDGSTSFLLDSKDTVSGKFKLFLDSISSGKNYLGLDSSEDFDTIYNDLSALLANNIPDYDKYIQILSDTQLQKQKKWVKPLVDKLQNADQQIKNQFVVAMTKHYVKMNTVLYDVTDGVYSFSIINSNSNSVKDVIINDWKNKLMVSDFVESNDEGDYIVNKEKLQPLLDEFKTFKKTKPNVEELEIFLNKIGLPLFRETIEDIVEKGVTGSNGKLVKYTHMFSIKTSPFVAMINVLEGLAKTGIPIDSVNIPYKESVLQNLAKIDAKYNSIQFSNSHQAGDKTVFSYTNNKYIKNRERILKTLNTSTYEGEEVKTNSKLTQLMSLSFNGTNNQFSRMIKKNESGDILYADNGEVIINTESKVYQQFEISYLSLETLKKIKSNTSGAGKLDSNSPLDHEVTKLALFANRGAVDKKGNRTVKMFYPTMSDKSTMLTVNTVAHKITLNEDGTISNDTVDLMYNSIVLPEIERILSFNELVENDKSPNIKGYVDGANKFLITPELNNIETLFVDGELRPDIRTRGKEIINDYLHDYLENVVEEQINDWKDLGVVNSKDKLVYIDRNYNKHYTNNKTKAIAADYALNYMLHNMNMFQNTIGDPALYYKSKSDDVIIQSKDTFTNMGKRLAGDIAPGYEIPLSGNFTMVYLNDRESKSLALDFYETLKLKGIKDYREIEGTDAQEFTTWKEHLTVMLAAGKFDSKEYSRIYNLLEKGEKLSDKDLKFVMQPMKPVYVNNKYSESMDVDRRIYIKSSSFPLLPQITKGLEIDKLRVAMEHSTKGADRAAFYTAVKVGAPIKGVELFNEDGTIIDNIDLHNRETLTREGWRIQQEVPYSNSKEKINTGTQGRKLLFNNIRHLSGFNYKGEEYSAEQLEEKFNDKYHKLFKIGYDSLVKELEFDGKTINIKNLSKMLQDEAIKKNYGLNDILALEEVDGKFKAPIWALNSQIKIESLLMSMVNNSILKSKHHGKSYVLGSEEGFSQVQSFEDSNDVLTKYKSEIVWTSSMTGKLLPHKFDDATFRPSQILVPTIIKDKDGKLINMRDYATEVDGKLMLDESKIPKSLLELYGFRIPTQGHNSMMAMEIVGFLPEVAGDLLIASRDLTKQMGSDFDVDKLYTYQKATFQDGDGNIIDIRDVSDEAIERLYIKYNEDDYLTNKLLSSIFGDDIILPNTLKDFKKKFDKLKLQNDILDIHLAVLTNPNKEMQALIAEPISFGEFKGKGTKEIANTINDMRGARLEKNTTFNPLSATYQRKKFINATAGKAGVAIFSIDSTFNSLIEGKGLKLQFIDDDGEDIYNVQFGNESSDGTMGLTKTLNGEKYISDVIAAYQSSAVDNENEQILDKVNINNTTFKVIKTLSLLGFDEVTISAVISQDIIFDYVKEIVNASSLVIEGKNFKEIENEVKNKLLNKYKTKGDDKTRMYLANKSADNLMKYIEQGDKIPDYNEVQRAVLKKFINLNKDGDKIQTVQRAINSDSKGLSKNIYGNDKKLNDIVSLPTSEIKNATELVGDYITYKESYNMSDKDLEGYVDTGKNYYIKPNGIVGYAAVYGVATADKMFKQLVPYSSKSFQGILDTLKDIKGNPLTVKEIEHTFRSLKSYLYTKHYKEVFDTDLEKDRYNILIDEKGKKESLATVINKLKNHKDYKTHPLISRLQTQINTNGNPSMITFNAAASENFDESSIYTSLVDMILTPKNIKLGDNTVSSKDIAMSLTKYSFINGGIQQSHDFVKFIPFEYLVQIGLVDSLNSLDFDNEANILPGDVSLDGFIRQYYQNNSYKAKEVSINNFPLIKDNDGYVLGLETKKEENIPFVRINRNNVTFLFQFDGEKYVKIPILGHKTTTEYNFNLDLATSVIETRNYNTNAPSSSISFIKKAKDTNEDVTSSEPTSTKKQSLITSKKELIKPFKGAKNQLEVLLDDITDEDYLPIAQILKDNLPNNFKFEILPEIVTKNETIVAGTTQGRKEKLSLRLSEKIKDNNYEKTLLHETVHLLTKEAILDGTSRAAKNLKAYHALFVNKLQKKYSADKLNDLMKRDTWQRAAKNLEEFTAIALTDKEFQKFMRHEIWQGEMTFWDKFINTMKKVLENLGVKPGTPLDTKIIDEVISLIDENKKIISKFEANTKASSKDTGNPFGENPVKDVSTTESKPTEKQVLETEDEINRAIERAMNEMEGMDPDFYDMLPLLKKCK